MDKYDFDDIKTTIISAVIILNITLNVIVVAVIVRYPELREDRTTLFMLSLTLSDLANGCTAMPISAALCSKASPNVRNVLQYLPKIHAMCSLWFGYNSMYSLCWVTVCKMVAVTKPLHYEQILSRNRCYFVITGIWLSGAIFATTISRGIDTWDLNTCIYGLNTSSPLPAVTVAILLIGVAIGVVLPPIVMAYATARIFSAIFRAHRQITAQINSIGGHIDVVGNIPSLTSKSIRSGRNVLIICLAFIILTIPEVVYATAAILGKETEFSPWFKFIAAWTVFCNSFINSLIYLFIFRYVRRKAIQMFKEACKCA